MKIVCLLAVCMVLLVVPGMAASAGEDVRSLIERGDAAWEKRGTDGAVENRRAADLFLMAAAAAPFDYEAHWKAARSLWWMADQELLASGDRDRQRDLGSRGMELARRAVLISPDGQEGRLYWALSALHYCYGIGMVEALRQGVQEEAARHLVFCCGKNPTVEGGLALMGLSSLCRTAPRPIRDTDKSVTYARDAAAAYPASIRAAVLLAAALLAAGSHDEAMELITAAAETDGNPALEPDWAWWKRFARTCVQKGTIPDPERLM